MLPQDPCILVSYLNTKLRDRYPSLSSLCEDLDADEAEIIQKLTAAGFNYDEILNKFIKN